MDFGLSFDQSTSKFDRSTSQDLRIPKHFLMNFCHSSLIDLQNIKTQKITKASENNRAKGLTSANQGVQIDNIWHSSSKTHGLLQKALVSNFFFFLKNGSQKMMCHNPMK